MSFKMLSGGSKCGCGFLLTSLLIAPLSAAAQDREPPRVAPLSASLNKPGYLPFSVDLLRSLRVPRGFEVNVFARPQGNTRMMAVDEDGTIYLTRQAEGDVLLLRDANSDGLADEVRTVASGLELVHGITIYNDSVYLIAPTKVWIAEIRDDGTLGEPRLIIDDLPDGGQHRARTIDVGPDGMLYMGVGSTCNSCDETNPENATILRANLDGSNRTIFARGLRHTIGFQWHPQTGELWGMDMGSDWRGDDIPPEELNRIVEGGNYGWPFCYGRRRVDPYLSATPRGTPRNAYCAATLAPVLTYRAHSAPIDFEFYTASQFPRDYQGDAFVTLRGSWNRTPPSGYKVVRVEFEGGRPVRFRDFLTGFLVDSRGEKYQFARIAGLAVARDGSLLVSDDSNGVIYRVSFPGNSAGSNAGKR